MHIELTEDIFENREKILVKLQNAEAKKIIENAKNNWIEYTPKSIESNIVGVDSSQNQLKFQGHAIWAVKANAVDVNSKVLFEEHDYGHDAPSDVGKIFDSIPPNLEYQVANNASPNADFVLIDGSLSSRFYMRQQKIPDKVIIETLKKCKNILYISKNSTSNETFSGELADIAYYTHATDSPGFSKLRIDDRFSRPESAWKIDKISYTFVRMPGTLGCFKLELYGTEHTDDEVKSILDKIKFNCVKGYPFVLKQAHNKCELNNRYMQRVKKILGMSGEFGAREILEG